MFSFIFGKPKTTTVAPLPLPSQPHVPAPNAGASDTAMATIKMLSDKESDLEKRISMLEKNVARFLGEATEAHKAGQKAKAILALKKKNLYEEQIKTNSAMLLKIVEQKTALEGTVINSGTLSAMSIATSAMKAEQQTWSVDNVRDLTDALQDVKDAHREITDLLQEPFMDGPSTEELTEELDDLVAAAAPAPAPVHQSTPAAAATTLPVLPAVPTGAISAGGDLDMERELAALVATPL